MKAEEIGKLGLREGDRVRVTIEGRLGELEFPSGCIKVSPSPGDEMGLGPSDIVAIDRVMPELPAPWKWSGPLGGELARCEEFGRIAAVSKSGGLECWIPEKDGGASDAVLPVSVAKVLIEVWEARR